MTALVRTWLLGVTCAAMVLALSQALAPEGGVKRVCKLAGGLVVLLAAVSPLLGLEGMGLSQLFGQYSAQSQTTQTQLKEDNDFLYAVIIGEQAAAYISDKAEELGAACQASVRVEWDDDGTPVLAFASITGSWTQEQQEALSALLEGELGIPAQAQYFERTEP